MLRVCGKGTKIVLVPLPPLKLRETPSVAGVSIGPVVNAAIFPA